MGFTIAEKILGIHSSGKPARAGQVVVAEVDYTMIHDARAPGALAAAERLDRRAAQGHVVLCCGERYEFQGDLLTSQCTI